ncbi:diaminopimelate decarboxylase [Peptococcaceae bacterium]|nr:diaminopimelate decarboxylase [Peptococcaceae bacterium]
MQLYGNMKVNERGNLEISGCDTVELAKEYGTPLYVIDEAYFRKLCREFYVSFNENCNSEVLYAGKALLTLAICKIVSDEGLSLDVVSGGELYTAMKAGFPMERVYFHGNNKSLEELKMAVENDIGAVIVDNIYELELLNTIADKMQKKVKILLRLTPGIEAHTHEYIKTGQIDSKFGLVIENGQAMDAVLKALDMKNIDLRGFHCHIGSQIFELAPYEGAAAVMLEFAKGVYEKTGFMAEVINFGGGLGIYYADGDKPPTVKQYADVLINAVKKNAADLVLPVPKIMVEPGRSIAGHSGITLYTVGAVKEIPGVRKYVAVDGGMNDNLRPALYEAKYEACIANKMNEQSSELVSIAGKCCESGDMLIWDILLPKAEPGDILAVFATGAYNYSMSMNYNRLPRPAMVMVKDGDARVIVKRETYDDIIRNDVII